MPNDLELARQQFIGYRHAQQGYLIEQLVEAMGLSAKEWKVLRNDVNLSESDKAALDEYFE